MSVIASTSSASVLTATSLQWAFGQLLQPFSVLKAPAVAPLVSPVAPVLPVATSGPVPNTQSAPTGLQTQLVRGTLRSGQLVETEGHLLVLGDVHPGSELRAGGDIVVWGELRGIAHAGYPANRQAEIRALHLDAIQLRIADGIARRPDRDSRYNGEPVTGLMGDDTGFDGDFADNPLGDLFPAKPGEIRVDSRADLQGSVTPLAHGGGYFPEVARLIEHAPSRPGEAAQVEIQVFAHRPHR